MEENDGEPLKVFIVKEGDSSSGVFGSVSNPKLGCSRALQLLLLLLLLPPINRMNDHVFVTENSITSSRNKHVIGRTAFETTQATGRTVRTAAA